MTTLRSWSIFFATAALVASQAMAAAFSFSVTPRVIRPGERVTLKVELPLSERLSSSSPESNAQPEISDDSLSKIDNLELLDQQIQWTDTSYTWTYEFTSYERGQITLPALVITLGPESFSTERTQITVQTERLPDDQELRPNQGALSPPIAWTTWLLVVLVFAGAAIAYRYRSLIQKRRTAPLPVEDPTPRESDEEWLRRELLILRARMDASVDGRCVDWWSHLMREFASRSRKLPVLAWTTAEIRQRLEKEKKWATLSNLLEAGDQIKFEPGHKDARQIMAKTLEWIKESERVFL